MQREIVGYRSVKHKGNSQPWGRCLTGSGSGPVGFPAVGRRPVQLFFLLNWASGYEFGSYCLGLSSYEVLFCDSDISQASSGPSVPLASLAPVPMGKGQPSYPRLQSPYLHSGLWLQHCSSNSFLFVTPILRQGKWPSSGTLQLEDA